MTNIAFFNLRDNEEVFFRKNLRGLKVDYFHQSIQELNPTGFKDYSIISILGLSRIDKNILDALPNVKLITTRSTGFDQIDTDECFKRGIKVANIPAYGEVTVAEYTFALLLTLSRNITQAINRVKLEGKFNSEKLTGFDLNHKTIGVVGTGRIGCHVIKIAQGFGMEILAFDLKQNNSLSKKLGFKYVEFNDLLKKSDILTFHVPYFPSTHHLINLESLKKIKHGVVLINTARGEIIDTGALIKGLRNGKIAGAALDVLEGEKSIKDGSSSAKKNLDKLLKMDNVIISPHNAYNTNEAKQRIMETALENIKSFLKGKPINLVKT